MEEMNKNGYLVMGEEGYYSDYEVEPYYYAKDKEDALAVASEAVLKASKRKPVSEDSPHYNKIGFERAIIYNLDTMERDGPILIIKSETGGVHTIWERENYKSPDFLYILYPGLKYPGVNCPGVKSFAARMRERRIEQIQKGEKV